MLGVESEKRCDSVVGQNESSGNIRGTVVQAQHIGRDVHINTPPTHINNLMEFLKAVTVAGALLGLSSSSAPAGAVVAVDPPVDVAAAPSAISTTTTPPPTSTPLVTTTSRPTAETRPATSTAAPVAAPNHRYTSAPDLTGAWELDFTRAGADAPERYTITLKRLADTKCGGNPPCYGGQWFYNGEGRSNTGIMWASPAPTGFTATDVGPDQNYRGTIVEDDTRRPLVYKGTWTADGGQHATFVFTRVA